MSCEKWKEVDLADYVESPDGPSVASFHRHVESCSACRREVGVWREMLGLLARGPVADHPSPATLLRWADARDEIPAGEAATIVAHLDACLSCADEVTTRRSFDLARITPEAPVEHPLREPPRPGLLARLRAFLGELEFRPAYALVLGGLVAAVLIPRMWSQLQPEPGSAPAPTAEPAAQIARLEAPAPAIAPAPAVAPGPRVATPADASRDLATVPREAGPPPVPSPATAAVKRAPPSERKAANPADETQRERTLRKAPAPAAESAVARAEPAASPTPDTKMAANTVLDQFLGKSEPRQQPGGGGADAVGSSALGFDSKRTDGARDGSNVSVAALDGAHRAVVTGAGSVRLRLLPPDGSAPEAAVRVAVVSPDGERWTVAASIRFGSAWREITLPAERLEERGEYALLVSSVDTAGEARNYDAVLELR